MDLVHQIIAREQRAAEDRLIADREARRYNLKCDGPMRRPRLTESVDTVRPPIDVIRQVMRDEEYVDATTTKRRRPSLWSRFVSKLKRLWFHPPEAHTHRIIVRAELKQFETMPCRIDDLMEVDEKGHKIKFPKWKKITVDRGTTGRLCKVLFAGALILELADGSYVIAGWEHVSKL